MRDTLEQWRWLRLAPDAGGGGGKAQDPTDDEEPNTAEDMPPEDEPTDEPPPEEEAAGQAAPPADKKPCATPPAKPAVTADAPATVAELEAALPKASADFLLACVKGGLTVAQAQAMHVPFSKANAAATPRKPGGQGLSDQPAAPTAAGDWLEQAKAYATENKCSLAKAMSELARKDPDAHAAYVMATRQTQE